MSPRILVILLLLPTFALADDTRCEAIATATDRAERTGMFRVSGLAADRGWSKRAVGLCGGAVEEVVWRGRAEAALDPDGHERHRIELRHLYRSFAVEEGWTATLGKAPRGWDVGYAAQPIDFLGDRKSVRDPEDRLGERKASAFAALDHTAGPWSAFAVFGEYRLAGDRRPQFILSAERNFGALHAQAITQAPRGEPPGLGGAVTQVIGQALELHASGFVRQGNDRPVHQGVVADEGFRLFRRGEQPVAAWQADDGRLFPRWVAGGQWTSEDGLNLVAEWVHDRRGLSRSQWHRLAALTDLHAAAPPAAADGNLRFDASSLWPAGTMRDYAFLRAAKSVAGVDAEARALVNLADGSADLGLRLTLPILERFRLWLDLDAAVGRPRSEFGSVPGAATALLAASATF